MSSSCQFQKLYKDIQIEVECCQSCYQHPDEKHQQSQFVQKINEIQAQLKRCWQHSQITMRKNEKKPSPRINSFQITYRNLLVFSKLNYLKFPKPQNIATIMVGLINKSIQEIHRVRQILPKIGNKIDLYTYLSSKTKNLKFSLKFVVSELDKIIKYSDENQTKSVINKNQQGNQENKQSIRESSKIKKLISIKQSVKQNRNQNYSQFSSFELRSTYRNLRKTTRNSGFDSRMVDPQNANRLSAIKKEQTQMPSKYSYLSKDDDVFEYTGFSQPNSQQIQLLQLSEDENTFEELQKFNYESYVNKQELRIKKIEEGLNFKLTSIFKQKKASRKYSFQYKKFAQLIEKQLKSDETLAKQLQTTQNKKSGFYEHNQNKENTSSQTISEENAPSVYALTLNEFESKADVLRENQSMRQLEQKKYTLHQIESKEIDQNQCKEQESEDHAKQHEEQSAQMLQPQLDQSHKFIAVSQQQQNESESKPIIQQQLLPSNKEHYYDQHFAFDSIEGIIASEQIIQAILTPQCFPKEILAQISIIVLYIHQINPGHFCSVLNTDSFQQIALSETPSFYKVMLFNPTKGLFQNYLFKLSASNISIYNQVPSWVFVVCYCIFYLFYSKQSLQAQVQKLIRLLTGIPIVKVPAIDLRKVKKLIYQSNFQNQSEAKGKVLGVKANQQNIINFCQIQNFKKNKEFLNSVITFKKIDCKENQQTKQAKYEEFAVKYDFFLLWFQKENYFHNQFHCIFQKKQEEMQFVAMNPNPTCKLIFSLSQASQIFVEYTEHIKTEKPNHILVCKFCKNNILQPVGELHKNGNFFFQLFLEAGQYALQISRCFDQKQANSIHFYSSSRLTIEKQEVSFTSLIQFTR